MFSTLILVSHCLPVDVREEAEYGLVGLGVGGRAGEVVLVAPLIAVVVVLLVAQHPEGGQHVEDQDRSPADEEEEHDQDQHVDNLGDGHEDHCENVMCY